MSHTQYFAICAAALVGAAGICLIPPAWGQVPTVSNTWCQDDGECAKGAPTCCASTACNYCEHSPTQFRRCKTASGQNCRKSPQLICSDYLSAFCVLHGRAGQEADCVQWSCDYNGTLDTCKLVQCATP